MEPIDGEKHDQPASNLVLDRETQAYNEAAFSYFLELERKRSERSNRPFMLLLADFGEKSSADPRMEPMVASSVLTLLGGCLRDTDVVGWYVDKQIAGAVLTERTTGHDDRAVRIVRDRVTRALSKRLPKGIAARLQVRVYSQMPSGGRES